MEYNNNYKLVLRGTALIKVSFFLTIFACSDNSDNLIDDNNENIYSVDTLVCEDWGIIETGNFIIENNVWNKGNTTNYSQCIFLDDSNGVMQFGWEWVWPNQTENSVKSYPEVIYGSKPWNTISTTSDLPVKIGNIQSLSILMEAEMEATGAYNLAYDIWITETDEQNAEVITKEIMIWFASEELTPAGEIIETMNIDSVTYDLYQYYFPEWEYLAFHSQQDISHVSIQLHQFLNAMIELDLLSNEDYIASIELGNEIVEGQGRTVIRQYSIILKR